MGEINIILKIEATYYDQESVITADEDSLYREESYYLTNEDISFKYTTWYERDKKLFKETFHKLDDGIFLVMKPVIVFKILNTLCLDGETESESESELYASSIYKDIKDIFGKFDKYGESNLVFSILVKEHWWQCWEGDWDCSTEYIGLVNNNFKEDSILTEKSAYRYNKRIEENRRREYEYLNSF